MCCKGPFLPWMGWVRTLFGSESYWIEFGAVPSGKLSWRPIRPWMGKRPLCICPRLSNPWVSLSPGSPAGCPWAAISNTSMRLPWGKHWRAGERSNRADDEEKTGLCGILFFGFRMHLHGPGFQYGTGQKHGPQPDDAEGDF